MKMLEAARDAGPRKFIYAASSSCYGIPQTIQKKPQILALCIPMPNQELRRATCYALGTNLWYRCNILRFFNVYGPRARTAGTYGAVFGVFLRQKIAGKPFTVVVTEAKSSLLCF